MNIESGCPLCKSALITLSKLDKQFILDKLSNHFQIKIIEDLKIDDYKMQRCINCNFEFANPLIEGSSSFYNWVTNMENYYPHHRWEYDKVISLIKNNISRNKKLLDVGCGDGRFFDLLIKEGFSKNDFIGIDPTQQSVEKCLNKGYKVLGLTTKQYIEKYISTKFDVIVSFHVLEHLSDPIQFIKELLELLNTEGCIYLSTPYSPMSFEVGWFDVLNHPPHHLGRWSKKSYLKLSEALNLDCEFYLPKANNIFNLAMSSLFFSINRSYLNLGTLSKIYIIVKNIFKFINHLKLQYIRDKVNGKRAADVILVRLTKKNNEN